VKARGGVFLDYEAADIRWRDSILAARFGGFAEITLGLIGGKIVPRHEDLPPDIILPLPMLRVQSVRRHEGEDDHAASALHYFPHERTRRRL
jgi:hypothetical protein